MQPLALYIHIPYCLEKCPYCDFHSVAVQKESIEELDYAHCLIQQLKWETERLNLQKRVLLSIFFGGGTPSLMSSAFFEKVMGAIAQHFVFDPGIEITVETNPATAAKTHFEAWLQLGINRVSFGIQSFQDPLLKKLGRNHSSKEAKQAIRDALDAGFSNVSLDLIFGIEDETFADLKKDLDTAQSFDLPHISAYQLTVESGTPLASWVKEGKFKLPDEERLVRMHKMVSQTLEEKGLPRYEISNYAKPGFESRHNLQYWRSGDYLGIGSGAVSYVNGRRRRTTRKLRNYLAMRWDYEDEEIIDERTALKEKWMMGLRLAEGLLLGYHEKGWQKTLSKLEKEGFLKQAKGRVCLTPKGFLVSNQITQNVFDLIDRM